MPSGHTSELPAAPAPRAGMATPPPEELSGLAAEMHGALAADGWLLASPEFEYRAERLRRAVEKKGGGPGLASLVCGLEWWRNRPPALPVFCDCQGSCVVSHAQP